MTLETCSGRPINGIERLRLIMRGRLAKLITALMLYTLIAVPFIMERPPKELVAFLAAWLGGAGIQSKLILFVWTDAAMNKLAVILGTVLAGGIIVDEKARGTLGLLLSKPLKAGNYFMIKLAASGAAFSTFYLAAMLGALATFPGRVPGFNAVDFLALSAVQLFTALFAVAFAGTMAVVFERKLAGMLVSIMVLGMLVSLAFLGFHYPEMRTVSYLNPFFIGVVLIGSIGRYNAINVATPIIVLIGFNILVAVIGRYRAAAILERR
jgi:ABC-2 type transport system permease protein